MYAKCKRVLLVWNLRVKEMNVSATYSSSILNSGQISKMESLIS